MDPWSPTYRSCGVGQTLDIVTARNQNGNSLYLGKPVIRPHPLDRPPLSNKVYKEKKPSSSKLSWWNLNDPEMKRRRRVAKYKLYSAEGKLKASFKKGFKWLKRKCSNIARRF